MTDFDEENERELTQQEIWAAEELLRRERRAQQLQVAGEARQLAEIEQHTNAINGLTKGQRHFLLRYLLHGNATKAADEAGYAYPNKQGPAMLKKKRIQAAIDAYFAQHEMSAKEVIARLSQQARAEYAEYLTVTHLPDPATGQVFTDVGVDVERMVADGRGHLIKAVKYTRTGRPYIEFADAFQALVKVGQYHSLFTERIDANVASRDDGMTVDEWREAAARRREETAAAMAEFDDGDGDGDEEE